MAPGGAGGSVLVGVDRLRMPAEPADTVELPRVESLSMSNRNPTPEDDSSQQDATERPLMYRLAQACARHFLGHPVPSPEGVKEIADLMQQIRAPDLGLVEDGPKLQHIEFVDVLETPHFTVGIFLIPEGRFLPLHGESRRQTGHICSWFSLLYLALTSFPGFLPSPSCLPSHHRPSWNDSAQQSRIRGASGH